MTLCRFNLCAAAGIMSFLLLAPAGKAQNPPPAPAPPPPTVSPATQAAIAAQHAQANTPAPGTRKAEPDYPDPRSLTFGVFYWVPFGATGPGIFGGSQATGYETLTDMGKARRSPGIEASVPVTRTGSIHVELFRVEGTGNQNAPAATTLFGTAINQGDYLATQYKLSGTKIYLDDLLFPHKFPVSRFRLKSLWEFQYISLSSNIYAPFAPTTNSLGQATSEFASGSKNIYLPTFGLAAEYALTPHLLLRVDASGFGIFHKADLWDAEATISYRYGPVEVKVGAKAFHVKSSPNNTEYVIDSVNGAFVGLLFHSPFFER